MSSVNHAGSVLWCANFDPCFAILSGVKFPSYLAARCEMSHLISTYSLLSVAHLHYLVPPFSQMHSYLFHNLFHTGLLCPSGCHPYLIN